MTIEWAEVASPVGAVSLAMRDDRLSALAFRDQGRDVVDLARHVPGDEDVVPSSTDNEIIRALRAYFAGDVRALSDLRVETRGTPFQERVWAAMRGIGPGERMSYAELAATCGAPSSARAVARACATNPVGIVIPCHRVVGSNGDLRGYGGGLDRKAWLLEHEARGTRGS